MVWVDEDWGCVSYCRDGEDFEQIAGIGGFGTWWLLVLGCAGGDCGWLEILEINALH